MNEFRVIIETKNAAFTEYDNTYEEISRILRAIADKMENEIEIPYVLHDINGNTVGRIDTL